MIIFPLKKEWYEKIKSGEKTVEYREVKDYWNKRFRNEVSCLLDNQELKKNRIYYIPALFCKLRLGYTSQYMTAKITKVEIVDGKDTDLHIDKPVYAIHLIDVREEKK